MSLRNSGADPHRTVPLPSRGALCHVCSEPVSKGAPMLNGCPIHRSCIDGYYEDAEWPPPLLEEED